MNFAEHLQYIVIINNMNGLSQHGPTGSQQATSGSRPLATRPEKLFVNFLLAPSGLFTPFIPEDFKEIMILISSAALCTNATHATDIKTL
jgi:hypothetical protein